MHYNVQKTLMVLDDKILFGKRVYKAVIAFEFKTGILFKDGKKQAGGCFYDKFGINPAAQFSA